MCSQADTGMAESARLAAMVACTAACFAASESSTAGLAAAAAASAVEIKAADVAEVSAHTTVLPAIAGVGTWRHWPPPATHRHPPTRRRPLAPFVRPRQYAAMVAWTAALAAISRSQAAALGAAAARVARKMVQEAALDVITPTAVKNRAIDYSSQALTYANVTRHVKTPRRVKRHD